MIVILNGPPNSGKDTIGISAYSQGEFDGLLRFKEQLYKDTAELLRIPVSLVVEFAANRELKDKPHKLFYGRTPRQMLIHVSEKVKKPAYGEDYYGKALAEAIQKDYSPDDVVVVTDGGFSSELIPLKNIGHDVLLVKLYREGCDFSNDSRDYLDGEALGVPTTALQNDSTVQQAVWKLVEILTYMDGRHRRELLGDKEWNTQKSLL